MAKVDIKSCGNPLIREAYYSSPLDINKAFDRTNAQAIPLFEAEGYSVDDVRGYYLAEYQMGVEPTDAEKQASEAYIRICESNLVEGFAEHMARAGLHARLAGGMKMMIEQREGEV